MANIRTSVAAATAVAGYDTIVGEANARVPNARKLVGIAYTGSAAAGDSVIELMVNNVSQGKFENSSTGVVVDMAKDFKKVNCRVPANGLVQTLVRTAPGTNPVVTYLEFIDYQPGTFRRSYRRSSTKRTYVPRSRQGMY